MGGETFDLIVYLDADWDTHGSRNRQHFLIREIAHQVEGKAKVLALERPICPITGPFLHRRKFLSWVPYQSGLRQEGTDLFIYTPFVLLHNVLASFVPGLTGINRKLLKWQIDSLLRRLEFKRDNLIAWIHHPYQLEDVGLVREKFLVYDCYDDYFSNVAGRRLMDMRRREKAILECANMVFVASQELLKRMSAMTKQIFLLPNGADARLFHEGTDPEIAAPGEIASLPHPIIGFVGRIAPWLDFKLLAGLVKLHSEWSFVFIGKCDTDRKLSKCPEYQFLKKTTNVYFLGPKPHRELRAYLKKFDVGIIPYLLDGQVPSSSPLKLYEYMAAGKPVVSVDIPHVSRFQPLVRIASGVSEWEKAIQDALSDNDNLAEQRLQVARENSWSVRAKDVLCILKGFLGGNP